ncbi:MAG TPA: J domain-containing protein [Acidimicrobiales bacterium]|jgi:curved DNA-binding protein CbpA|nr:J domain-containing protein [Acidimicrobiales bacterium]
MASHYDTLGVQPEASAAELRAAYLALARQLHPDRHAGRSPADVARAERAMQDVNAAWSVLSDPASRRTYDQSRRPPTTATVARPVYRPQPAPVPPPEGPEESSALYHLARIGPLLVLLAVLGAIFVFTAFAAGGRSVRVPDRSNVSIEAPHRGDCVVTGRTVEVVSCDSPNDGEVIDVGEAPFACPVHAAYVRFDASTVVCIRPTD